MCDLAIITLEKISIGVSVTKKKLPHKKNNSNLAKQLFLKETKVQKLKSEFKCTKAKA